MKVEYINGTSKNIPLILIFTELKLLNLFFKKNLLDDVFITISDLSYSNNWIALK